MSRRKEFYLGRFELCFKVVRGWPTSGSWPNLIGITWGGVVFDKTIEKPGFFAFIEPVFVRRSWRLEVDFIIHKKEGK